MTGNNDEIEILNQSINLYSDDTEKFTLIALSRLLLKNGVSFSALDNDISIHSIKSQLLLMCGIILNNLDLITLSLNKYNARPDFPLHNIVISILKSYVPSYFRDNPVFREFNSRSSSPNSVIETDKFQ